MINHHQAAHRMVRVGRCRFSVRSQTFPTHSHHSSHHLQPSATSYWLHSLTSRICEKDSGRLRKSRQPSAIALPCTLNCSHSLPNRRHQKEIGRNLFNQQLSYSTTTPMSSHFLSFSSGRARRRRRKMLAMENARKRRENEGKDDNDNGAETSTFKYRTAKEVLWPSPYGPEYTKEEWAEWWAKMRNPTIVTAAAKKAWTDYMFTWEGFWEQRGLLVYTKEELAAKQQEEASQFAEEQLESEIEHQQQNNHNNPTGSKAVQAMMQRNARRNARAFKKAALMMRKEVREKTGIKSKEDLRRLAGDTMKLMSECLKEFMEGYREGRDEETENVLKKYFQDIQLNFAAAQKEEEERKEKKRKRRKVKRRQLSLRAHSL